MAGPMSEGELRAIRELVRDATAGPWVYGEDCQGPHYNRLCDANDADVGVFAPGEQDPIMLGSAMRCCDAEFIAHARQDVPALLAEVERLREYLEDAERRAADFRQQLAEAEGRG